MCFMDKRIVKLYAGGKVGPECSLYCSYHNLIRNAAEDPGA